jgi:hypothetical protein
MDNNKIMAKEQCFIIAPISTTPERAPLYLNDESHCEHLIDHLLAPAAEQAGFDPIKPKAKGANLIHAEIVQNLQTASLVLCDMSGLNPNVFFELGIRTAMNKPICLVIDEATKDPPFDLDLINHHRYVSDLRPWILPGEVAKLATHIKDSTANKENALWKYFSLRVKADTAEQAAPADKIDLLVAEFDALRQQLAEANAVRSQPWRLTDWSSIEDSASTSRRGTLIRLAAFRNALLEEAQKRKILVVQHTISGDGGIEFVVGPASKVKDVEALSEVAKMLNVKLRVGIAPPTQAA